MSQQDDLSDYLRLKYCYFLMHSSIGSLDFWRAHSKFTDVSNNLPVEELDEYLTKISKLHDKYRCGS